MKTEKKKVALEAWRVEYALKHKFGGLQKNFADAAGVGDGSIKKAREGEPLTVRIAEMIAAAGGLGDIPETAKPVPEKAETPEQMSMAEWSDECWHKAILKELKEIKELLKG